MTQFFANQSIRRLFFGLMVVVVGLANLAASAQDQTYDTLPMAEKYVLPDTEEPVIDPDDPNQKAKPRSDAYRKVENLRRQDKTAALEALKAGKVAEAATYLTDFLFPEMTQQNEQVLSDLGKLRDEFNRFVIATSGASRKSFIETVCFPTLKTIAEGNYHPSARLNAILIIGSLNDVDTSTGIAPTPNAECVKYLLGLTEKADAAEFLLVGAFTGLHRVAEIESIQRRIEQGDLDRMFKMALATVQNKGPGQDKLSAEVSYWLKRRSAQILGSLKNKGQNNETSTALMAIVADKNVKDLLRIDAMEALKEVGIDKANAESLIDTLIAFAAEQLESEAVGIRRRVEEYVTVGLLLDDTYIIDSKSFEPGNNSKTGGDKPGAGTGGGAEGGDEENQNKGSTKGERKPGFDLPNHALNTIRRKAKAYLYQFHRTFSEESLTKELAAADKDRVRKALRIIERALKDTDIGLVDLGKKPDAKTPYEEELKTNSVSDLMYERFMAASTEMKALKRKIEDPADTK
ncbi:MAG: hypothetical protein ABL888_12315 [Pirellulaceae bacterium]